MIRRADPVVVSGVAVRGGEFVHATLGTTLYVSAADGSDTRRTGQKSHQPLATIGKAISLAEPGDAIIIDEGEYEEAVTIPADLPKLRILGLGSRGAVAIASGVTNGTSLTNHAEDVVIENIGAAGDGTGFGVLNTGRRFRAIGCKFEGGAAGAKMQLGTVAQITAASRGKGDDCWLIDCELAWSDVGLLLGNSDYGALTQLFVRGGVIHNCTKGITELNQQGGSASILFRDLHIEGVTFRRGEDGSEPTNYIDLNGDNGNTGIVAGCRFPTALNSGKNLVSTGLLWVGNFHPAGLSTTQPS